MTEERLLIKNRRVEIQKEIESLKKQLKKIRKGHINILYRNNKGYYYLTYRDGSKIKNDYLGPVGTTDLSKIMKDLNKREAIKKEIRTLKEEENSLKARKKHVQEN